MENKNQQDNNVPNLKDLLSVLLSDNCVLFNS